MTDNNSSKPKSTVDSLNDQDDQNTGSDSLLVFDAYDTASGSAVSSGLYNSVIRANALLVGNDRDNTLRGTEEDDVIRGLGGNDRLFGLGGNDQLFGNAGNDRLFGAEGDDTLTGGGGRDRLEGEAGNDTLLGNSGRDTLISGDGQDYLEGNGGDDQLNGGRSADTLLGGTGRDRLLGGRGRDVLTGGLGQDTLSGGPGRDQIIYNSFDDRGDLDEESLFDERGDEIVDFVTDEDVIDLSRLFTGSNYAASDPFREYVILFNDEDDDTFIRVDVDGDSGDGPFRTLANVVDVDFDDIGRSNFII